MNVEIICVGTELLLGEVLDTNSYYLAKIVAEYGLNHYYRSVVGDNSERLRAVIATAFDRGADLVMLAGGLGPTVDDITKQIAAEYLGLNLIENKDERDLIARKYDKLASVSVPESVYRQAEFPRDSTIFPNDNGTAPGCLMSKNDQHIIVLPGPPSELQLMVETYVRPIFAQWQTGTLYSRVFNCIGLGESVMEERLLDIDLSKTPVSIAPYAGDGTSRVRISVRSETQTQADSWLAEIQTQIEARIGEYIYSIGEQTLPELMAEKLINQRFGIIDCSQEAQLFWQFQPTPLAGNFCEVIEIASEQLLYEQLQVKTINQAVVRMSKQFKLDGVLVMIPLQIAKGNYQYTLTHYHADGTLAWQEHLQALVPYSQQPTRTITKIAGYFWRECPRTVLNTKLTSQR